MLNNGPRWNPGASKEDAMTQEERRKARFKEVMGFLEENHRNPSKHRIEEHDMLNWVKANRKALNAGKMKSERIEAFEKLLALMGVFGTNTNFTN